MATDRSAWLLLLKGNKVLVVKRSYEVNNPGQWGLPGGSHRKQRFKKLIQKETFEEIGLRLRPTFVFKRTRKGKMHKYFVAKYKPMKHGAITLNYESVEFKWVKMKDLESINNPHRSIQFLTT